MNYIIQVCEEFELREETFFLCVNIFDRYINNLKIDPNQFNNLKIEKILITCIFISSKYEEIYPPYLREFLNMVNFKFSEHEILTLEEEILSNLNFECHTHSALLFLNKYFNSLKNENKIIYNLAYLILIISMFDYEFCSYKPSFQAAISLYAAKKFNKDNDKDNYYNLFMETNYSSKDFNKNLKLPFKILENYFKGNYTSNYHKLPIYLKFNTEKYNYISKIIKDKIGK